MSVIVTGMEMTRSCYSCDFADFFHTGEPYCKRFMRPCILGTNRPDWCPLLELPEKHGKLISANGLKETLDYYIQEAGWDAKTNRALGWVKDELIDSEPTIVEAEGD